MKNIFHILILLVLYIKATKSTLYSDIKENVLSFLNRAVDDNEEFKHPKRHISKATQNELYHRFYKQKQDRIDAQAAKKKAEVFKKAQKRNDRLINKNDLPLPVTVIPNAGKERFHMDPVLNFLQRRARPNLRRKYGSTSSESSSSSLELKEWKNEWKEMWLQKKIEAMNGTHANGDAVNMVAARPWGVPCGDPNQHDMPWGTCMLPMECESEYRIYRGDYFCGRTQFVCCALQHTSYDLYQGFDVSFAGSSLSTDSDEKRDRLKGSKEKRRKKQRREKRRRKRQRLKRKKKIKRNIKKIIKEIRKILDRSYRNGTNARKRKTKELKKFIKALKKQYRKDRQSVKDVHELQLIKIDSALQKRLDNIKTVNQNFVGNSTFRDIVVNGTINKKAARMLMQAYPELATMLQNSRRGGSLDKTKDYLEYDIEYGMVYY